MRLKNLALSVVVVSLFLVAIVSAEEKLGVQVYPTAKFDKEATEAAKRIASDAACYRTNDSVEKVVEFYLDQPDLRLVEAVKEAEKQECLLKKGQKIDIRIQNPWKDAKTGKSMSDTLISIVKKKE